MQPHPTPTVPLQMPDGTPLHLAVCDVVLLGGEWRGGVNPKVRVPKHTDSQSRCHDARNNAHLQVRHTVHYMYALIYGAHPYHSIRMHACVLIPSVILQGEAP